MSANSALDPATALEARYPANFSASLPEPYRAQSFNLRNGTSFAIDGIGKSAARTSMEELSRSMGDGYRIVFVHGTMYNPEGDALQNPHLTIYEVMRRHLDGVGQHTGVGWDSVNFTLPTLLTAWRRGQASWYGLTNLNAQREAPQLAAFFSSLQGPYAVVCHSMGCEMVRQALQTATTKPVRILMLSPDTDYAAFEDWTVRNGVPVLHSVAMRDGVLRFSRWAKANAGFRPSADQSTYRLQVVDVDTLLPDQPRVSAAYGNPRRFLDHMAALEVVDLWDSYADFLTP